LVALSCCLRLIFDLPHNADGLFPLELPSPVRRGILGATLHASLKLRHRRSALDTTLPRLALGPFAPNACRLLLQRSRIVARQPRRALLAIDLPVTLVLLIAAHGATQAAWCRIILAAVRTQPKRNPRTLPVTVAPLGPQPRTAGN